MTVCPEHSGLDARLIGLSRDLRDVKRTLRWLTGAVLALALAVGGPRLVASIASGAVAGPAAVSVSE